VYVEGNDLVLKLENGKVEHLIVPDSDRFTIDGRSVRVSELKPGTTLTQTITTVTTPRYVNTVRVLKGKVWHVSKPYGVILTLPDGTNQAYTIPKHAKITVNGRPGTSFDLRKGMMLEATVITDEMQTVVSQNKATVGQAPPPATPPMVGILLIQPQRVTSVPAQASGSTAAPTLVASAESVPAVLPRTGSPLPLIGLLGALAAGFSLVLGTLRRRGVSL
jgi:hypothetical protein